MADVKGCGGSGKITVRIADRHGPAFHRVPCPGCPDCKPTDEMRFKYDPEAIVADDATKRAHEHCPNKVCDHANYKRTGCWWAGHIAIDAAVKDAEERGFLNAEVLIREAAADMRERAIDYFVKPSGVPAADTERKEAALRALTLTGEGDGD